MRRSDLPGVKALINKDPISHSFLANRLIEMQNEPFNHHEEIYVYEKGGQITSALYHGANTVPIETNADSQSAFAWTLVDLERRSSSLVGPVDEVLGLWKLLKPFWGIARDIRANQPMLNINQPPLLAPDPLVRRTFAREVDLLLPACVSMFTEEVGVSPVSGGGLNAYRMRIAELISSGRSLVRIDRGEVVFKAEVGIVTDSVCQIQGVWVPPQYRGRGYGKAGMAAVVSYARMHFAPNVSLYVNDYNERARAIYKQVGFAQHSTFATVLF
jgi:predicted GNAT family acetyltransferase